MPNEHAPDRSILTRRTFTCGVCALAGLGVMGASSSPTPNPGPSDAHTQERQIGQQVYDQQRQQGLILDTSPYYPVLRAVGGKIAAANQPRWYPQNFIIVKGTQANAFSVPGGNVYVNVALLQNAENEEELASVLGHETGHMVLGHVMNRIHQAQTANTIGSILSLFIRNQATFSVLNFLGNYAFLNFSRAQEYQADHEGVILANKAGYNPYGMVWFFQKLNKLYGDAGFEQYVQDHPSTNDRITRIEQFFQSDPAQFGKWQNKMTSTSGLTTSTGSDAKLILSTS
jgi:predicted Zn-dependent protease